MRKTKFVKQGLISILVLTLAACSQSGIEISSKFDNSTDIKEGTSVFFNDAAIGEVIDVAPKDGGAFVTMTLNTDSATQISPEAAVVVNRLKPGAPLEIHNPGAETALGLQEGQKLKGLDSMMGLVAWSVGDALKVGSEELSGYVDSFQEYLQSEEFAEQKAQVKSQLNKVAEDTAQAIREVETEVQASFNDRKLDQQELAKAIEQLGDELSPVVEEAASNAADLVDELARFTQGLEQQSTEQQESSAEFMNTLVTMLQKLNDSMERGFEKQAEENSQPEESTE